MFCGAAPHDPATQMPRESGAEPGTMVAMGSVMRRFVALASLVLALGACLGDAPPERLGVSTADLTAAARRARAAQIRDAAFANGMTEGWLLAGIADAETGMAHCWSELTWACMGPTSSDCGGGPVVAGAGDGPCPDMQGGLGMFQFDAGTYDQTLAREGTRILSVAGNVAAAVDFVVGMVIRSTFISGVDTRDQAIAWMNGVRIGNASWDPWISTVTRYYNGCSTTASCWPTRYANYRNHTADTYNEMGADFWVVGTPAVVWAGEYVSQSFPFARDPFPVTAGTEVAGYIEMRNTGTETWRPGSTFLGTTEPRDVASAIAGSDWVSANRAATVDGVVAPGGTGRFSFSVRAPATVGDYPQYFNLVEEGVAWFSAPGDMLLQIRVQSTAAVMPTCPTGIGAAWSCEGTERVRCESGVVVREACASCTGSPATCGAMMGSDVDGDGWSGSEDCDDLDPSVHPGAVEVCANGIDDDCAGGDWICTGGGDGGVVGGRDGGTGGSGGARSTAGGCSVTPGSRHASWAWALALGAAIVAGTRRRR